MFASFFARSGPYFIDYFHQPSKAEIGTMVAILEIGAFISSLLVGRIGDIIGRRKTILYGSCIFFVGGALQTGAASMAMMMVGRIVAGFGVGMLSTIVPVYQSEISPPHNRGKLACIEFSGNIIGYTTSVWVDYFCGYIEGDLSWRIPLLMQCIMGALLGLGSLIIVESPRYVLLFGVIFFLKNPPPQESFVGAGMAGLIRGAGGFLIMTTTKKASLLSPTSTEAVIYTTIALERSFERSRWTCSSSGRKARGRTARCSNVIALVSSSPCPLRAWLS